MESVGADSGITAASEGAVVGSAGGGWFGVFVEGLLDLLVVICFVLLCLKVDG